MWCFSPVEWCVLVLTQLFSLSLPLDLYCTSQFPPPLCPSLKLACLLLALTFSCHNKIGDPEEEIIFSDLLNVYFLAIPTHFCSQELTLVSTPVKELPVKMVGFHDSCLLLSFGYSPERGAGRGVSCARFL